MRSKSLIAAQNEETLRFSLLIVASIQFTVLWLNVNLSLR